MKPLLDIRRLSKNFTLHMLGGKRIAALMDVSFAVGPGEILGLVGKSGSGKSSLMKCIYRAYLPTSGEIAYRRADGTIVELAAADPHTVLALRRQEITYCSQFLSVIPRVPAAEVVAEAAIRRGLSRDEAIARGQEAFERISLPRELWDAYPATFSGGEQQRVNIARAILARPRLLLLDEPTASLDPATKDAVIAMIRELQIEGTSMILITHDSYTLDRLADRRVFLEDGRLVEPIHA